jgi:alpha-glucosidase
LPKKQQELLWWQHGTVYQIYPRSFKDTSGNGVGDLQGIIDNLNYLNDCTEKSLGIDVIWISPFYPSPMADFGYDVSDYVDIHPLFGDLSTFDRLVAEAHKRDIKVIIDYVPNHSSDEHPWFLESRSSRDNPKRDWYIWKDAKPDGSPPNNWGSAFGGPAWTWDEKTGQYYLHQFLNKQPELNWRTSDLRDAMMDVLHFWLGRGVDGFRMDVVGFLIKDEKMRDNPISEDISPDLHPYNIYGRQLHKYNEDQDEVQEIIRDFRKLLDGYDDRCAIGELGYRLERWVRYFGENGNGLHLPFNFRLIHQPWEADAISKSVEQLEAALPSLGWPNYVLGNHDNDRLLSRIGMDQARIAAMLLLTLRGTPTLYYGDEIGLENGSIPPDKLQDPQGLQLGAESTRDVCRTPMQWDSSPNAGFSVVEPWLPISHDYETRNVHVQSSDPTSILNLYRRLIWYRKRNPILLGGSYKSIASGHDGCFTYLRENQAGRIFVALNFSDKPRTLKFVDMGRGSLAISTFLDRAEAVTFSNLSLRPHEGVIVEMNP